MSKQLIIAEKPSMARDIAAALGVPSTDEGHYESDRLLVTFCFGHLVELAPPDAYDERLKDWRVEDLPFIPARFKYRVNTKAAKQFKAIRALLGRDDVSTVVNACDAGREGELIFDLVYKAAGCQKPVMRLWVRSLTAPAIREAFKNLLPASAKRGLLDSAHARQRADWLVGLNATRAETLFVRRMGGSGVYSLGRVQTPTLALVVDRDNAIDGFKPADFFKIKGTFSTPSGETYSGWWFTVNVAENRTITDRFDSLEAARAVVARASGTATVLIVNHKTVAERPPLQFDITQLQRAANRLFGFTAARTLELAQSLYEKKAITYPRSDSQYLSSDLKAQVGLHLAALRGTAYGEYVSMIEGSGWTLCDAHVDDAKVTDHHALIPDKQRVDRSEFGPDEAAVYDLIVRRFLASFYPHAQDSRTQIVTKVGPEHFSTRGVTQLAAGWREVDSSTAAKSKSEDDEQQADADESEAARLPVVEQNAAVTARGVEAVKKQTRAPARFTEGQLLAAMETAGKVVSNDALRDAMKARGLGAPGSRDKVIEKLVERGYVVREKKKFLRSTPMGRELIALLRAGNSAAAILASPELTGAQEEKLLRIEAGKLAPEQFIEEISQLTGLIVTAVFSQAASSSLLRPEDSHPCPKCKAAGRAGMLRTRKGKEEDSKEFLACSLRREDCGYISDSPKKAAHMEALASKTCPKCSGAMRLRYGKESGTPFLSCCKYPDCEGVVWLESKKGGAKGGAKGSKKGAGKGSAKKKQDTAVAA